MIFPFLAMVANGRKPIQRERKAKPFTESRLLALIQGLLDFIRLMATHTIIAAIPTTERYREQLLQQIDSETQMARFPLLAMVAQKFRFLILHLSTSRMP